MEIDYSNSDKRIENKFTKSRPVKNSNSEEKLDPCFDKVLDSISPNLIRDQLDKILCFLHSDVTEKFFPTIWNHLEVFIQNIVHDNNKLKYKKLINLSRGSSTLIFNILNKNKHVYILKYEGKCQGSNMPVLRKHNIEAPINSSMEIDYNERSLVLEKSLKHNPPLQSGSTNSLSNHQKFRVTIPVSSDKNNNRNRDCELPLIFKKASLQTILDFVCDPGRATLVFQDKTLEESRFLMRITGKKAKDMIKMLPDSCKSLLAKIGAQLKKKSDFNIVVTEGKYNRAYKKNNYKLKDVTFSKVPLVNNSNTQGPIINMKAQNFSDVHNEAPPMQNIIKATVNSNNEPPPRRMIVVTQNTEPSKKSSKKEKKAISGINFESSNGPEVDRVGTEPTATERHVDPQAMDKRKRTLWEAMSTPVQSDKAMKMMMDMGWDGGALGLRGEGIVEPIIPALELKVGAGLGHKRLMSTPKRRKALLENLHEFLLNDNINSQLMEYNPPLDKDMKSFFKNAIQHINERRGTYVYGKQVNRQVRKIVDEMIKRSHVLITMTSNIDGSEVILTKQDCPWPKQSSAGTVIVHYADITKLMADMSTYGESRQTISQFCALRQLVLAQILDYLKIGGLSMTIRFTFEPCQDSWQFMLDVSASINKRAPWTGTRQEAELYRKILRCIDRDYILIERDERSLLLKKIASLPPILLSNGYKYNVNDDPTSDSNRVDNNNQIYNNNAYINNKNSTTINKNNTGPIIKETNDVEDDMRGDDDDTIIVEYDSDVKMMSDSEEITQDDVIDSTNDGDLMDVKHAIVKPEELDMNIRELEEAIFVSDLAYDCHKINETDIKPLIEDEVFISNTKDQNDLASNSKRIRSDSINSNKDTVKKTKLQLIRDFKRICIVPKNYPEQKLTIDNVKQIQMSISDAIDVSKELPIMKCHGLKDGSLVYGCFTEKSFFWLENVISVASDMKIIDYAQDGCEESRCKVMLKMNCFCDVDVAKLFVRLEIYNVGLSTSHWKLLKKEIFCEFISITIQIDYESFKYVSDANFSLFAGIDEARFSVVWD